MASKSASYPIFSAILVRFKAYGLKGVMGSRAHLSILMGQLLPPRPRPVFEYMVDSRARAGALKLHTGVADLLLRWVSLTDCKTLDSAMVKKPQFGAGDLLSLDRPSLDYAWPYSLPPRGPWFVTRLTGDSFNSPAWPELCSFRVATSGPGFHQYHRIIGNLSYPIWVPDTNDLETIGKFIN